MNIEVHQLKLEALLQQRMASGKFESLEELLTDALEPAAPVPSAADDDRRTGAELVAVMQSMPYKDVEFEPTRQEFPIRDVKL